VRELAYQINNTVVTTDVQFTLRVNQGAVQGTEIEVFPKAAAHDLIEFDPAVTVIHISVGALVDIQIRVRAADLGTYLVGGIYRGWYYPEEYFEAYRRSRGI